MTRKISLLVTALLLLLSVTATTTPTKAQGGDVTLFSTQFNNVQESELIRGILTNFKDGSVNFVGSEEGPLIDLIRAEGQAGKGVNDVVGALHGTFPTLAADDLLMDLSDLLAEIEQDSNVIDSFVTLGKMGTTDYQYYIPWMQATYVMAAHKDALQYLPDGADINALTWDQLAAWAKAAQEATGKPQLGFPVKGLFHRFLEGYLYPSFTGGMVSQFKSKAAADMMAFVRDDLWPYVNPESINYDFMNQQLLSGEVMIAFDHVARLKPAFDERPDDFVAFPAPAGPAGRGYMPVVAGLAIPYTAPNPDAAKALIKFMLSPETQAAVVRDLGFYPMVEGVDTSNLPAGIAKQLEAVEAQSNSADSIVALLPIGLGDRGGEINQLFRNVFNRIVIEGQDIQTVLDEEGAALQKLMTETGASCWAPDPAGDGPCQVN
ncbi:MAG: carbohydrate ABC transporter substrate-binding protein [Anaerolineae bacterium]|nr:carbohydrate ABC transporter substrate-binding protein [Anaerolineae bacterium]